MQEDLPAGQWSKHTADVTVSWFHRKETKMLERSSQAPDLNPIKHLWEDLKLKIHQWSPPPSIFKMWRLWEIMKHIEALCMQKLLHQVLNVSLHAQYFGCCCCWTLLHLTLYRLECSSFFICGFWINAHVWSVSCELMHWKQCMFQWKIDMLNIYMQFSHYSFHYLKLCFSYWDTTKCTEKGKRPVACKNRENLHCLLVMRQMQFFHCSRKWAKTDSELSSGLAK